MVVDQCVFGVDVKDAAAEFVDVQYRINKLTEQVAGIPFDAENSRTLTR